MKVLRLSLLFAIAMSAALYGKALTVNDQIVHWTPKMIEYVKTGRDIASDADQKEEAQTLLVEWNSFKNNLSARKSNQKVFLKMSKRSEMLLKQVQASLTADCKYQRKIQRMLDDIYVGQNKVRGKK